MRIGRLLLISVFLMAVIIIPIQPVFAAADTDTMVGYWKMDSSSVDVSGSGNNLTATGNPSYSTAVPPSITFPDPQSIAFTGTQYLSLSSNSSLNVTNLTLSAWVRFNNVNSTYQTIVGKWQVGVHQQYVLQLNSDNTIGLFTGNGSTGIGFITTDGTFTPSSNTWYHIAAVVNGTTGTIYINGVSRSSGAVSAIGSSSEAFSVGSKRNAGGTFFEFLNGNIDDLRIYNRALSATEISALAAGNNTSATWDGTSTDFETASNWNPVAIPDPYTNLVISPAATYPVLTSSISAASLTIQNGASFNANCQTITYNDGGGLTNNGSYIVCPGNNSPSTNSGPPSVNQTSVCSDNAVQATPDLFQIDAGGTYANLYFTAPVGGDGFAISYGLTPDADQFGDNFNYNTAAWTISRTISWLTPNTTYYFKVRATNGCNAGLWSETKKITTRNKLADVLHWYANLSQIH